MNSNASGPPDISALLTINYKRQASAPNATSGGTASRVVRSRYWKPASMLACQQSEQGDVTPRTAGLISRMKAPVATQNRFSFESELTFAPKLNATSMKMVKERGNEFRTGVYPNNNRPKVQEKQEPIFTFKPQVSETSAKICEGLGTTFMARQELHLEKQKKLYEKSKMPFKSGRLTPVQLTRAKYRDNKLGAKENDNAQVAWATPSDTPTKIDLENGRENLPPVVTRSASLATNLQAKSPRPPAAPQTQSNLHLQRLQDGSSLANGSMNFALRRNRTQIVRARIPPNRQTNQSFEVDKNDLDGNPLSRSKTLSDVAISPNRPKVPKLAGLNVNRIRNAKLIADKAMKTKKIFSIHGPYPVVRECLRKRGWVEKQYRYMAPHVFKKKGNHGDDSDDSGDSDGSDSDDDNNNDDSDDDYAGHHEENLEESDSIYGIMSRMVRNATPSFIWTVRRDSIDYKYLRKDAIVNHYARNGSFTTKVGLCTNLRNLHWFEEADPDTFFPRCYKIGIEEEKLSFIDDYRLCAATGMIRWVIEKHNKPENNEEEEKDEEQDEDKVEEENEKTEDEQTEKKDEEKEQENSEEKKDEEENKTDDSEEKKDGDDEDTNKNESDDKVDNNGEKDDEKKTAVQSGRKSKANKKRGGVIPSAVLETAMKVCDNFLDSKNHEDIDIDGDGLGVLTDNQWDSFLQHYYQLIHDGAVINNSSTYVEECQCLYNRMKSKCPQLHLDGTRNVWIVKPGAKSRGRGIMCMDRLEDITKLVASHVRKENKWVVQKYIERPLLVYDTKFDIRQWFLVTDWNPLTIWFYEDCYLRFCSHKYTLDSLDQKIHLANNSIQKFYENEQRSPYLPDDNMWSCEKFDNYLRRKGHGDAFREIIYPGMKEAIISALQCTQDIIDPRKNSFELYGADFMVTDDLEPWLIEINSSPAMSASSYVTEKMCYDVIEDTMKVVLDRKHDKNCDTGKFELIHKQQHVMAPAYTGINLHIEGQPIRKPGYLCKQRSVTNITPRVAEISPYSKMTPKQSASTPSVSSTSVNEKTQTQPNTKKSSVQQPVNNNQTEKVSVTTQVEEIKKKLSGGLSPIDGSWGKSCRRCGHVNGIKLHASETSILCQCSRDSVVTPTPLQLPHHARYIASPEPIPRSSTFIKAYQADAVRISQNLQDNKSNFRFPPAKNIKRLGQTVKQTPRKEKVVRTVIKCEEDGAIKPQTCQMTIVSPR